METRAGDVIVNVDVGRPLDQNEVMFIKGMAHFIMGVLAGRDAGIASFLMGKVARTIVYGKEVDTDD